MTKSWKTYQILMIFLLLWFIMPGKNLQAQHMPLSGNSNNPFSDENNVTTTIPEQPDQNIYNSSRNEFNIVDGQKLAEDFGYFQWIATNTQGYMQEKRGEYSVAENENFIRLYMEGIYNTVNATQKQGEGNFMYVDIYGNSNEGNYLQVGSDNFIYDQIGTQQNPQNGVYREINQYGKGLGIENTGNPTTHMIINQWGQDMKLQITESPIH